MIAKNKKNDLYLQVLLLIAVYLMYSVSINYPMYDKWDDLYYVIENKHLSFSIANIVYWFKHACLGCYVPITMISYMFDYSIWELNSFGYHLQNIFWHIIATIAIYNCFRLFKIKPWIAFFICLIFAIHPQRVESVVWISERKDVLCAAFYFLSIFFYIRNKNKRFSITAFILFILAILSKPMAVSLPFVLVLYEFYRSNKDNKLEAVGCRLKIEGGEYLSTKDTKDTKVKNIKNCLSTKDTKDIKLNSKNSVSSVVNSIRVLRVFRGQIIRAFSGYLSRLWPYFFIMLLFIPVMFLAQGNSVNYNIDIFQKIYTVLFNVYWYTSQTLFCNDLNPIYPLTYLYCYILEVSLFYFGIIILGLILFFKNKRNFFFRCLPLVFCYLITLAPVIGFLRLGNTDHADRYSYIPSVFILFIVANLFSKINSKHKTYKSFFFKKNLFL